jgi:2-polyprenyl-3-methyl-5-hydroxy-6-metoxy-1,4-benzoquinol methylase
MSFYKEFEDHFRGSEVSVSERLKFYLPIIEPLKKFDKNANILDLGCGRGEFLSLAEANGFDAQGIDTDDGMIAACQKKKLKVIKSDSISYLKNLDNDSFSVISSFHMIEHISYENLLLLIKESLRILKPGGLLIMETPNPDNIRVATNNFYVDPTHLRPIPSDLLLYLVSATKFAKHKVIPLNEDKNLRYKLNLNILDVIFGASPDYTVIAQKNGPKSLMDATSSFYLKDYGLTTYQIAEIYSNQQNNLTEEVLKFIKLTNRIKNSIVWKALRKIKVFTQKLFIFKKQLFLKFKLKLLALKASNNCPICLKKAPILFSCDLNKSCGGINIFGSSNKKINYATCNSCNFSFAVEMYNWKISDFKKYIYNDEYNKVDPDYAVARPIHMFNVLTKERFINFPTSYKHLDFGGGSGFLSKLLSESGWNSQSYDLFVDGSSDFKKLGKFDLITAYEVFEHISDVNELVSNLKSLLNTNGIIHFTTLSSDNSLSSDWWYAAPRNGHISLFSKKSLKVLAGKFNLKLKIINDSEFIMYVSENSNWPLLWKY